MKNKITIVGEIPARLGSKRVKQKNLRLINGKPLIAYAIEACKSAKLLDSVYVNSESEIIGKVAKEYEVNFYKRKPELAEDCIVSDQFNYDFLKNIRADILAMINPISPLMTGKDIDNAINYFLTNDYDTVISVREERLQSFCEGKAINFNPDALLPMTQNIPPIQLCCWAITIWRTKTFVQSFEEKGYAVFSGKVGFYPLSKLKAIKISTEEDFLLAEAIMNFKNKEKNALKSNE